MADIVTRRSDEGKEVSMADIRTQQDDKATIARTNANSATSVPDLKVEVMRLAEAVQRLEAQVARLVMRQGRMG